MDRPGAHRRGRACGHAVPRGGDIALAAHCVMRVLHVVAGAPTGGAETFSLDAITALAERGIEQKVLCRPHRQTLVRLGVPQDALLLLTLSRLHPKKGIDTAIRALARLPNAHLCIAGDGPEQAKYETLAHELGLTERVRFLGWRNDRKALLEVCDICL